MNEGGIDIGNPQQHVMSECESETEVQLKVHRRLPPAALQVLHGALHALGARHVLHRAGHLLRLRPQQPQVPRGRGERAAVETVMCGALRSSALLSLSVIHPDIYPLPTEQIPCYVPLPNTKEPNTHPLVSERIRKMWSSLHLDTYVHSGCFIRAIVKSDTSWPQNFSKKRLLLALQWPLFYKGQVTLDQSELLM